jgi:hypothetical protein
MIECRVCHKVLDEENFYFRIKEKNIRHKICKDCKNDYDTKFLQDKKERIYTWLKAEYGKCEKCGEQRFHLLDFHHKNPELKDLDISKEINSTATFETTKARLQKEIQGCVRLCSNCHRDFHFLNKTEGIAIEDYLGE